MAIVVLDPIQEAVTPNYAPAPRLGTLTGKTLGLYNNAKLNAEKLVELIRVELEKAYSFRVVRGVYDPSRLMEPDEWQNVDACDAILLANGDCGACSTSGIANAIEFEKRGIPTLLVSTKPFIEAVRITAQTRGMPDISWAIVDHPIGSLGEAELQQRAVAAAAQFCELVLRPAIESSAA